MNKSVYTFIWQTRVPSFLIGSRLFTGFLEHSSIFQLLSGCVQSFAIQALFDLHMLHIEYQQKIANKNLHFKPDHLSSFLSTGVPAYDEATKIRPSTVFSTNHKTADRSKLKAAMTLVERSVKGGNFHCLCIRVLRKAEKLPTICAFWLFKIHTFICCSFHSFTNSKTKKCYNVT